MTTTQATATASVTTCAIRAQDFSSNTTDPNRTQWTAGKLRHVIAALHETPVVIVADRTTGHSLVNVHLTGIREGFSHSLEIGVRQDFGGTSTVWHLAFNLGDTIIPLDGGLKDAKWIALGTWHNETTSAIELAMAEHGECEGRSWGEWRTTAGRDNVAVTYTPITSNPAFADRWGTHGFWSYSLEQIDQQTQR